MQKLSSELASYRHIVWDMNGTLIDDTELCVRAVNPLLREHGVPEIDVHRYRQSFRFPVRAYYDDIGFRLNAEEFTAMSHRFHDNYHSLLGESRLFPGTVELLQELRSRGQVLSILTAAWHEDMLRVLDQFGILSQFDHLFALRDREAASKVDRGLELMRETGFAPSKTILLGDTLHDLEVGQAMGVEVLLLTEGHMSESRLRESKARVFVR